jgi:3-deoxy-7-phosphoheptulonate synthase
MATEAGETDVDGVVDLVRSAGGDAFVSRGVTRTIVGLVGDIDHLSTLNLRSMPGVTDVVRISAPYKLVSREHHRERSVIRVAGVPIGPDTLTVIAGPCAVETAEQTLASALMARAAGASLLRGGAYKPRSSPYAFQGLGEAGLKILAEVRAETGLPIVTEVVDPADVELVASYADMLQVGTRNMQNFPLLQAVGGIGKPVMLKRGMNATIEEWLMAAEYIAQRGNLDIVLCERGIRTFEKATRNTLDISAVPVAQRLSHLPVIVDPSHSGGRRDLVLPLSRAAIAVGADGIIVDVHPNPEQALCDGPQALVESDLRELASVAAHLSPLVGRTLTPAPAPAGVAGLWRFRHSGRSVPSMFERFTDRARRVIVLAQEEARLLQHDYIGTEHMLLGLITEGDGLAARVLRDLEINLETLGEELKTLVGRGKSAPSGHIPFTPPAKKSLELSLRESLQLGHDYIGTEHLLLGILSQGKGPGAQILIQRGVDLETVRRRVTELNAQYKGRRKTTRVVDDMAAIREIRMQLAMIGQRLTAIEARLGIDVPAAHAELRRIQQELAQIRRTKETAIDAQDFEHAASAREIEKQLLLRRREAEKAAMEATSDDPPAATEP